MKLARTALTAICWFTLLATGYLSLSLIVLRPPRANYPVWFTVATIVVVQGALTRSALSGVAQPLRAAFRGEPPGRPDRLRQGYGGPPQRNAKVDGLRYAVLAGGGTIAGLGAWMVREMLASSHFEGYNLLLSAMLVVQGVLTIGALLPWREFSAAPR